jgi:hypothetical protein
LHLSGAAFLDSALVFVRSARAFLGFRIRKGEQRWPCRDFDVPAETFPLPNRFALPKRSAPDDTERMSPRGTGRGDALVASPQAVIASVAHLLRLLRSGERFENFFEPLDLIFERSPRRERQIVCDASQLMAVFVQAARKLLVQRELIE